MSPSLDSDTRGPDAAPSDIGLRESPRHVPCADGAAESSGDVPDLTARARRSPVIHAGSELPFLPSPHDRQDVRWVPANQRGAGQHPAS
jgi:hypothetical protein